MSIASFAKAGENKPARARRRNGLIDSRASGRGVGVCGAVVLGARDRSSAAAAGRSTNAMRASSGFRDPAYKIASRFEKAVVAGGQSDNEQRNAARTPHHLPQGIITPNGCTSRSATAAVTDIDRTHGWDHGWSSGRGVHARCAGALSDVSRTAPSKAGAPRAVFSNVELKGDVQALQGLASLLQNGPGVLLSTLPEEAGIDRGEVDDRGGDRPSPRLSPASR